MPIGPAVFALPADGAGGQVQRVRIAASALTIVAIVAFVYWPGVHGFWGRDDFMQLAMVRLIGSPWSLFTHDHFVVPGSVFRPLGFASMWLGETFFGTQYAAHAVVDLALHAGVCLALFGLLLRARIALAIALPCTLLFGLHPAVLGTALWWSARFDLLATLFVLLAVQAGWAYRERASAGALIGALASALAAMLCKEIGLVGLAVLVFLWLRWAWRDPGRRRQAAVACALALGCAACWLGWRAAVLGTASSHLTGALPVGSAIAKGLVAWSQQAPGYLSFLARLGRSQCILLAVAAGAFVAATIVALWRPNPLANPGRRGDLAWCGASLLLLPALVQAPVAALNAAPLDAAMSAIEAAMQSRLYYLGIAGAAIVLAVFLSALRERAPTRLRAVFVLAPAIVAMVFGLASREAAQAFAQRSVGISAVARDAVAAVEKLDLPVSNCNVVFLGIQPPPEWSAFVSMDSVVKALAPDLARVGHCWFHTEAVTYFQLQSAPASASDAAPYRPLVAQGHVVPWRTLGDLTIAYLRAPAAMSPEELAQMKFLLYRDGRFDDVGAQVVAGSLAVDLH